MSDTTVDTRSELLSLLTDACELEHGLACLYLFAAFSLKRDLHEGIDWKQQQMTRRWAGQIYFVASQEMLHLSQAWNLLAAIGGTPYHTRPNFPQSVKYYPLGLPLTLQPFSKKTMERFISFEEPEEWGQERQPALTLRENADIPFRTVGELYSLIESGFERIPAEKLFIGPTTSQVGAEYVDFPDIVRVVDVPSAKRAIWRIREQGEGIPTDRLDCHFGIFKQILAELNRPELKGFVPARKVKPNPVPRRRRDQPNASVALIRDPVTAAVADLFDDVYGIMLRMLSYIFSNTTAAPITLAAFSRAAIELMVCAVKPLGETLTALPFGEDEWLAGPSFGMGRHISLPAAPGAAHVLVDEGLVLLAKRASALAAHAIPQLGDVAAAIERARATASAPMSGSRTSDVAVGA